MNFHLESKWFSLCISHVNLLRLVLYEHKNENANTTQGENMNNTNSAGILWIKLAVLYLIVGVAIGIGMGATQDFRLHAIHAHINLLGWATMGLIGLIYTVFPAAGSSKLAKVHFWLHNVSLPVMMGALSLLKLGNEQVVPVLVASEFVAAAGIIVFTLNIFTNLKKA